MWHPISYAVTQHKTHYGSQVTNNPLDNIQLSIPGTSQEGHSNEQDQPSTELQLETLRSEKATLEAQYGALLSKLTAMRTTLGDKLRQDAVPGQREQQICQLQTQNEDLIQTTENLKNELISSNEETERLHRELGLIRTRLADQQRQSDSENYEREEAYRESQDEIEHLRNQLEDSQRELMNEAINDDTIAELKREIEFLQDDRDSHARSASNLQSVLEEFQSAKESEIQSVVGDTQTRLIEAEQKLQVYEEKVKEAEAKLAAMRHEAVILNEHLTEALRRLRKDSTEYSVDRRLASTSPQKPNRQQNGGGSSNIQSLGGGGRDTLGDNDTITDQWVSFLLRESNATSPTTPTKSLSNLSITSPSTISNPSRSPISHRISPDAVKLPSSPGSTLSTLSTLTRPTSES
ncbi:hypothetical protein H4Q26_000391 [Puccinia striiformis f. sp. tritici PST-130]|nr:hypothetical protein H4Q26_000391 [Puccinia striiformis f. sp. tritici PST-130]